MKVTKISVCYTRVYVNSKCGALTQAFKSEILFEQTKQQ